MKISRHLCVLFLLPVGQCFQHSRRQALFALAPVVLTTSDAAAAANSGVLRSKECIQGQGEGCSEMAEENEFIRSLQAKSLANKDRNEREAKEAFYMKNYPDWFATVGKIMIKKSDGSFIVVDAEEAARLRKEGRLEYETARSKGGSIIDYTQKPVLVLKD